jgi:anaerobic magnesium-protoporphyrin IX monomethyl ester cyclase
VRILLAYKAHAGGATDPYTSLLPVGLGYINAVLRTAGLRSVIANLSNSGWKEIESLLKSERPDILGVSQFTHNRIESLRLAAMAKKMNPRCFVVFGGPHATHRYQEVLARNRTVDAVVMGEGEETFLELAGCLMKGTPLEQVRGIALRNGNEIVCTSPREPLVNLDALPNPAAFYANAIGVDLHRQLEFIITSRGCPAACRFCSSPRFWGKTLRFRSPQSIIDEIRFVRDRYGLLYFSLRDDTFTADRERVMEFCRLLVREKLYILWNCQSRVNAVDEEMLCWMKQAGCECVQFGVESGSRRMLQEMGKRITTEQVRRAALATRRAGINLSIYLITGVPGETADDLQVTLRLIEEIKPSDGQVSPLVYYPGTALYEKGVKTGTIREDLFEAERSAAFYVRNDPFVAHSTRALLAKLHQVAAKNRFTAEQFRIQKKVVGYCHATNILAGDFYENTGRWGLAEAEYREIVEREPANPWGWVMLGELYGKMGAADRSRQAFEQLLRLVPAHAPAYVNLGELQRLSGACLEAKNMYARALRLDPGNAVAKKGLEAIHGRKKNGET